MTARGFSNARFSAAMLNSTVCFVCCSLGVSPTLSPYAPVETLRALVLIHELPERGLVVVLVELGLVVRVVAVIELLELLDVDGIDGIADRFELAPRRIVWPDEVCGDWGGGDSYWGHC